MTVLIIGAGPAGLAASAVLNRSGIPNRVLEQGAGVGGAYAKVHPSMALLTPRKLSALPFAPISPDSRERITAGEYFNYLKRYQTEHAIEVHFGISVARIEKRMEDYILTDRNGGVHRCRQVIVATGMLDFPKPSPFDPHAHPGSEVLEAADWKGAGSCTGKTVLIAGSGITAAETAVALSERSQVYLAARRSRRGLPIRIFGIPFHYLLYPFEFLPKILFSLICGGYVREPQFEVGLRRAIREGKVRLCGPGDIERIKADVLINATGYRFDTSLLPPDVARDRRGQVRTRENQSVSHRGLFLIGYPCAGGIDSKYLRGIHRDAFRIARIMLRS